MDKVRTRQDLSKDPSVPIQDSLTPAAFLRTTGKDVFLGLQTDPGWPLWALPTTFLQSGGPGSVNMEGRCGNKQVSQIGGTRTCVSEIDSSFRKSVSSCVPQTPRITYSSTDQFYFLGFILRKSSTCVQRYWYKVIQGCNVQIGEILDITQKPRTWSIYTRERHQQGYGDLQSWKRAGGYHLLLVRGRQVTKLDVYDDPTFWKNVHSESDSRSVMSDSL